MEENNMEKNVIGNNTINNEIEEKKIKKKIDKKQFNKGVWIGFLVLLVEIIMIFANSRDINLLPVTFLIIDLVIILGLLAIVKFRHLGIGILFGIFATIFLVGIIGLLVFAPGIIALRGSN